MTLRPVVFLTTGSPAHAGIVPLPAATPEGLRRFPRARGDSPFPLRFKLGAYMVPPRTRG